MQTNNSMGATSSVARIRARTSRGTLSFGCLAAILAIASCREGSATPESSVVQNGASATESLAVLATIGEDRITMADIHSRAGDQLDQLEMQYRRAKSRIVQVSLDSVVQEALLSAEVKKTGQSAEALLAAEAGPGGLDPSDLDIAEWYRVNQGRTNGRPLDQVKPQIADLLRTERRTSAEKKLQDRLRAEHRVAVAYEPFRLQFNNGGAPRLGKDDAPVTLVEFSDFQCPYCQAAAPTLKQVEQKFGDRVQIVYRQFPLTSIHPFAFKTAEASLCANEQGKFWQLHDAMFADQKKLGVSDLKQVARRLGLDGKKFDGCLDSGRYVEQVQNDLKEGQRIGVTGTPAMFVNGMEVEGGAVPFSVLEGLIEKELAARK